MFLCPNSARQVIRRHAVLLIFGYISSVYSYKLKCILEAEKIPQQKAKSPYILFSWSFLVGNAFSCLRITALQRGNSLPHRFLSRIIPFRIFLLAFSAFCLPYFLHKPHFFQSFSLPLIPCDPLSYPLMPPALHIPGHTQHFHLRNTSCFPDTISHASSSAILTLQDLLCTLESTLQDLLCTLESRKHQVHYGNFVDHTAVLWPVDKFLGVLAEGASPFWHPAPDTTKAISRRVPTSCPHLRLHRQHNAWENWAESPEFYPC